MDAPKVRETAMPTAVIAVGDGAVRMRVRGVIITASAVASLIVI